MWKQNWDGAVGLSAIGGYCLLNVYKKVYIHILCAYIVHVTWCLGIQCEIYKHWPFCFCLV